MGRRYYRRRTVTVRPKKRWASNMATGSLSTIGGATGPAITTLVENSTQSSTPTPVIIKVGNIKLQGDATFTVSSGSGVLNPSVIVIVFYLPEGISVNATTASTVVGQHPEWIMAWKMIDAGTGTTGNVPATSFTVSSRLKRNLNSGDKICIGFVQKTGNTGFSFTIDYAAQYWTCAN